MVIRIETQDGAVGYAPGPASEDAVRKIEKKIAPHLLGQKLVDPSDFVEDMLDKYEDTIWSTAGAVEVALYDLWGKANQCSVTDFFGGRNRRAYPAMGVQGCIKQLKNMRKKRQLSASLVLRPINTGQHSDLLKISERLN